MKLFGTTVKSALSVASTIFIHPDGLGSGRLITLSLILALTAVLSLIPTAAFAAQPETEGLGVASHTVDEIRAFVAVHPASLDDPVTYKVKPSTSEPYAAGILSDETNTSALNMVNQVRYIAGLQSVTLDDGCSEKASASTLVLRFFKVLSHYFNRPEELKDAAYNDLYRAASAGARNSNLGSGFKNLNKAIINGWCADNGAGNLELGHRRWLLNPKMGKTGFGFTNGYAAMYVCGGGGSGNEEHDVAWPAQVTPVEYFSKSDSWSLSLGSWVEDLLYDHDDTSWIYDAEARRDYFTRTKKLTEENVTVNLVRRTDNKTWNFSSGASDGVFYVSTAGYGSDSGCVIFWPKGLSAIQNGDVFDVTVTVRGEFGSRVIRYSVNFFSLESPDIPDTTYPVTGGNLYFDSKTGVITGCDKNVTEAVIPSEIGGVPVTRIGKEAFWVCKSLTSVTVPYGVTSIGKDAFRSCDSLTSIIIPGSVTTLEDGAFYWAINLTNVTIPSSVTSIGEGAFLYTSLTDIYYGGSETQWNQIDIAEQDNYMITYAAIHYNSPMPDTPPTSTVGISVTVNGEAVAWTDAVPFIDANDRTMVPLRAVADAMGLDVSWDAAAREAGFSDSGSGKTIFFPIDSTAAHTSGGEVKMDTAAVIVSDRSYAPIRYLAEYFGYTVGWDDAIRTVVITG